MANEQCDEILHRLTDNIKVLHEENARLKQEIDNLKLFNNKLTDINLKLSQERDDLNVKNAEINRKLNSIQALFL